MTPVNLKNRVGSIGTWRAARVLVAQQFYTLPEGSALTDGIVTPSLR
jgi:hypothetical protein